MRYIHYFIFSACIALLASCDTSAGINDPGNEYVPDMGHSVAFEANHYDYYYYNTWGTEDEYYKLAQPGKPVKGTIPRNQQAGNDKPSDGIRVPINGSVPYYYGNTEDERTRATVEIVENPYPITQEGLARGQNLYEIFCGICHGEKGDGNGYLVSEDNPNAKYPAQPANFLSDEFKSASPGRYYHSIMHGKNVMGAYADKIGYEERWQVIHWIRALQAKDSKLTYNEMENTLNDYSTPGVDYIALDDSSVEVIPMESHDDEGHEHDSHSDHNH